MNSTTRKIHINVIKAKLLRDIKITSCMSPYFVVTLSQSKTYQSGKMLNQGKNPVFNETFSFDYANEEKFTIELFDSNTSLGSCNISLIEFLSKGGSFENDFQLEVFGCKSGTVQIVIQVEDSVLVSSNKNLTNELSTLHEEFQLLDEVNFASQSPEKEWVQSTMYFRRPYYFRHGSDEIFFFDVNSKMFKKVLNSSGFYFQKFHRATELVDGSFLITGGESNGEVSDLCAQLCFNQLGTSYSYRELLNHPRKSHGHIYNTGFVYVFGGIGSYNNPLNSVERFDTRQGGWKLLKEMSYTRAYPTVLNYDQKYIFIIGGLSDTAINGKYELDVIERYDLILNVFSTFIIKMSIPAFGCVTAMIDENLILIAGGYSNSSQSNTNIVYSISLTDGTIQQLNKLQEGGWSYLPAFYDTKTSSFNIFYFGEDGNLPKHVNYPISLPLKLK